jgi:hypothetical protein
LKKHKKYRKKHGKRVRDRVQAKTLGKCAYCGVRGDMTMDHIIPIGKKGPDNEDNLVVACNWCNSAKWDNNVVEFLGWVAHIRSSRFECNILTMLPKKIINQLDETAWDVLRKDFHNGK